MVYSFIGLGKPIAAVNNILKTKMREYRKQNPHMECPLKVGGIYATDLSMAASFAGDNDMCVYMSIDELLKKSDIIFIFLTDKALKGISINLGKHIAKRKIFCHFSPAYLAEILDFNSANTYVSMFLPYFSKDDDGHSFSKHIIAEGYGKGIDRLKEIFLNLEIDISFITAEEKIMYLTAVNLCRDMNFVLNATAQRLAKYALASCKDLRGELMDLIIQTPSELNTYNPIEAENVDFIQKQCRMLKALGISDITNLYSSLMSISLKLLAQNENTEKISQDVQKILDQK